MMKIYCRVTDIGLVPMYDSDLDEKKRLKIGSNVVCVINKPRNYEFLKKFFALVRLTYDNLPESIQNRLNINNEDDMVAALKIDLGLFTTVMHGDREIIKLGSISFAKMDDTEFEHFYNRCIDIILGTYLKGTERNALIEEIERFK